MEPAEGLEPSASGLRKPRFTVFLCSCYCAYVTFAFIIRDFEISRFVIVFLDQGEKVNEKVNDTTASDSLIDEDFFSARFSF